MVEQADAAAEKLTAEQWLEVEQLFEAALAVSEDRRQAFLDEHPHPDPEVARVARSLLTHASGFSSRLSLNASNPGLLVAPIRAESYAQLAGQQVGGFRLTQALGSGAMSMVFLAEQDQPRRQVAIKLLRAGVMEGEARTRFRQEIEVLGRLRHTGIAQIVSAGIHPAGPSLPDELPFFAMELVRGARSLTAFADAESLGREARIELFLDLCDAVHYGHLRGVVHRDLKPDNVLVDESGQIKVIDFGIARSVNVDLSVTVARTMDGALLGTLRYMSPEQCEGDPSQLDLRTDVYSLGVMLYELLSGAYPYDLPDRTLLGATMAIREAAPNPLGQQHPALRGDLETIVHTALAKHPDERYESVADLATDLRRYLGHEPIRARPPTLWYQTRKLLRRHRAPLGALTVFVTLLIGTTAWALRNSSLASMAEGKALEASQQQLALRKVAEGERDRARSVTDFLREVLSSPRPELQGKEVRFLDVMGDASRELEQRLEGQPALQAEIREVLGITYDSLGECEIAEEHLRTALDYAAEHLPATDRLTRSLQLYLGKSLGSLGRYQEALEILATVVAAAPQEADDDQLDLTAMAITLRVSILVQDGQLEQAFDLAQSGLAALPEHFRETQAEIILETAHARALTALGRYEECEQVLRRVADWYLQQEPSSFDYARTLSDLADVLRIRGQLQEAEAYQRRAIEEFRAKAGESILLATGLNNLGLILAAQGRFEEGVDVASEGVALDREFRGNLNPQLALSLKNLAVFLIRTGDLEEAVELLEEALDIQVENFEGDHFFTGMILVQLGSALTYQERWEEALERLNEGYQLLRRALGDEDPRTVQGQDFLRRVENTMERLGLR